ncbi:hypothetical protein, partial [Geothermobacter hydrogeniphilus]|uniref:hypothetical protein n=1 Tax=Geothermobacter hydrogeniphilus TaxID=1969733 RepID=UPI001E559EEC
MLENDSLLVHVEGQVRKILDGPASISYLGWRRYFLAGGIFRFHLNLMKWSPPLPKSASMRH